MPSDAQLASLQEQLNILRQQYAERLPARLADIATSWQTIRTSINSTVLLSDLQRAVHGLAGSGTTFGFTAISTEARVLEHFLYSLIERGDHMRAEEEAQIDVLIARLCETSQAYDADAPQLAFTPESVPPTSR